MLGLGKREHIEVLDVLHERLVHQRVHLSVHVALREVHAEGRARLRFHSIIHLLRLLHSTYFSYLFNL